MRNRFFVVGTLVLSVLAVPTMASAQSQSGSGIAKVLRLAAKRASTAYNVVDTYREAQRYGTQNGCITYENGLPRYHASCLQRAVSYDLSKAWADFQARIRSNR